jgi:hypothetical protein
MNYEDLLQVVTKRKDNEHKDSNLSKKDKNIRVSQSETNKQPQISTLNSTNEKESCPFSVPPQWKNSDLCKMGTLSNVSKFTYDVDKIDDLVTTVKQRKISSLNSPNIVSSINLQTEEDRCNEMKSLTNTEDIRDFYENTEECLKRIAKITPVPEKEIQHLLFELPFEEELKVKKLAVFDLDETLVHCEIKKPSKGEVQILVKIPSGVTTKVNIIKLRWVLTSVLSGESH